MPASRLTTQDSLTVAGQAFRAGVVTRRVWIESFDRFVHFLDFFSSPLLADVVVVVLAISQLTELGWRQHNKEGEIGRGATLEATVVEYHL